VSQEDKGKLFWFDKIQECRNIMSYDRIAKYHQNTIKKMDGKR
jgi:hypothetical protein